MKHFTIQLDSRFPDCTMYAYLHDKESDIAPRKAMIVCPGGAYQVLAIREGEAVATSYFAAGMQAFILNYSLREKARNDAPLIEAALAIKHLRDHAEEYDIDSDYIFISGFSAGGHCAAMSATLWNDSVVREALGIDRGEAPEGINKPTATVLGYPVISGHTPAASPWLSTSIATLSGIEDYRGHAEADRYSLELHVDSTTSPAFMWHTADDDSVSIESTLYYALALSRAGVPFEYHVYPHGPHGLSLANSVTSAGNPDFDLPNVAEWFEASLKFINSF